MNVALASTSLNAISSPILAVGVFSDADNFGATFATLEALTGGQLSAITKEEGWKGGLGSSLLVHTPQLSAKRVLLIGLGTSDEAKRPDLRRFAAIAVEEAEKRKLNALHVVIPTFSSLSAEDVVVQLTEGAIFGGYRYTEFLTDADACKKNLESVTFISSDLDLAALASVQAKAVVAAEAVCLARDLVNAPPITLYPQTLADAAAKVAAEEGLEIVIFDEHRLKAENMNLILAVGGGSQHQPRLVHMTYRPEGADANTPSVALVGKGLTYDAGGYNIKPTGSMEDMKVDMGGAAAVIGAMKAIKSAGVKVIVHGIIPTAENLVSHNAYKPGDIIRSHNGKTVEIMNTDAEGRLVLADALSYAEKLGVSKIVDLATLTGACMVALGPFTAGLFSNDDAFAKDILAAADKAGEDFWHMPLAARLKYMLKSPIADLKNLGQRWGGAITGALFLEYFVGGKTWAHLDIAGPASNEKAEPGTPLGGTGFGVLTLLELLKAEG